jgi:hypothetical protein
MPHSVMYLPIYNLRKDYYSDYPEDGCIIFLRNVDTNYASILYYAFIYSFTFYLILHYSGMLEIIAVYSLEA